MLEHTDASRFGDVETRSRKPVMARAEAIAAAKLAQQQANESKDRRRNN